VRAAAWEAKRRTPAAAGERVASREAFSGQSSQQALATALDAFAGLSEPVYAGVPLAHGQSVTRYVGDRQAQIEGPGDHGAALISTLPLVGRTPGGDRAPVDLRLQAVDAGFAPRSTSTPVVLPASASGEVRLTDAGFGVRLAGASDRTAELTQDRLWFGNVDGVSADTDALIQPAHHGAEISYVLRSASSPEDQVLAFSLPRGAHLTLDGRPGQQLATIDNLNGTRLGMVAPAAAVDAQGARVETSYTLDGPDRLVVHVAHRDKSYAYPIYADPLVASWNPGMYGAWSWTTNAPGVLSGLNSNNFTATQGPGTAGQGSNGQDGHWEYGSLAGAYIYREYSYNVWNFANNTQEFGGLFGSYCGQQGTVPGGCGESGTWQDGFLSGGSGPGGAGAPAVRYQGADESYVTTNYCAQGSAANCTPPPHGTIGAPNRAFTAGVFIHDPIGYPGWIPKASVYGDYLYESDDVVPSLATPGHSNLPSGWVQSLTDTVSLSASVPTGLGMSSTSISGPGYSRTTGTSCSSYPCTFTQNTSFPYGSSVPTGKNTYTSQATNVGGNQSNVQSWIAKVDKVTPVVAESGDLWNAPGGLVLQGQHILQVDATDGVRGGADNQQQAGVSVIDVEIRDTLDNVKYHVSSPNGCSGDSCDEHMTYTINTTSWDAGKYTAKVTTTDRTTDVPHVQTDTKTLTVVSYQSAADQAVNLVHDVAFGAAGDWSSSCSSPSGMVADGYMGGTYVKLRAQPAGDGTPNRTWVCYRASNSQAGDVGGRLDIDGTSASVGVPMHDDSYETCGLSGTTWLSGGLAGNDIVVSSYSPNGATWVCVQAGSAGQRVIVPASAGATPNVTSHIDQPVPPLPTPVADPYPSGTCQTAGGSDAQRAANIDGPNGLHLWAYTWQPSSSKVDVCARVQGAGSAGGMLEVDASGSPGVTPTVGTDTNLSACTQPVFDLTVPADAHLSVSAPGANPASVCLAQGSTRERVYVGTTGTVLPPRVTWTPDPGTPGLP
jgi:hypothetical protein